MFAAPLAVALRYKRNASPLSCNLSIFVCCTFAICFSAMPLCFRVHCGHVPLRSIENVWKKQQAIQHQSYSIIQHHTASYSDISAELQTSLTTGCGLMCTLAVGFRRRRAAWELSNASLWSLHTVIQLESASSQYILMWYWSYSHQECHNSVPQLVRNELGSKRCRACMFTFWTGAWTTPTVSRLKQWTRH